MLEVRKTYLRANDHYVHMFVKPDKLSVDCIYKKAPRAIQFRSTRYNLVLATYLRPYEHAFYEWPGIGPSLTRVVTKGLNRSQIAELFLEKASYFADPCFLSCDHSKFDSTIRTEHLRSEHSLYNRTFKNNRLRLLLQQQLINYGFSRRGIKYKVEGTRMSGDYNTGLGNCLINRVVLETFVKHVKHEIMLDGDDSVVIVERQDLHKLNFSHFERMGFETKISKQFDITKAEYCQSRLVFSNPPLMVRNPIRMLSHLSLCLRTYQPSDYMRWANACFECERKSCPGVPIFRSLPELSVGKLYDQDYYRKVETFVEEPVECTISALSTSWDLEEHYVEELDKLVNTYLGYNSTDIIGFCRQYRSSLFRYSELWSNEWNANGSFKKHKAAISSRFRALYSSNHECWDAIGTPIVEYAVDASGFAYIGACTS